MEATQANLVNTSFKNGVMTLELNFDPGNCYTHEMMKELDAAILKARFDNDTQAIVIRGAGEKFFCAGADINMLKKADPTFKYYFCLHANETLNRLEHTPKIVIAALNGHTVGGGLEIAMAADIRIARKGSGKVGLPEVNLGVGAVSEEDRLAGSPLGRDGPVVGCRPELDPGSVDRPRPAHDDDDGRPRGQPRGHTAEVFVRCTLSPCVVVQGLFIGGGAAGCEEEQDHRHSGAWRALCATRAP